MEDNSNNQQKDSHLISNLLIIPSVYYTISTLTELLPVLAVAFYRKGQSKTYGYMANIAVQGGDLDLYIEYGDDNPYRSQSLQELYLYKAGISLAKTIVLKPNALKAAAFDTLYIAANYSGDRFILEEFSKKITGVAEYFNEQSDL